MKYNLKEYRKNQTKRVQKKIKIVDNSEMLEEAI